MMLSFSLKKKVVALRYTSVVTLYSHHGSDFDSDFDFDSTCLANRFSANVLPLLYSVLLKLVFLYTQFDGG